MTTNPPPGRFEERLPRGERSPADYEFVRPTGSPDDARTLADWMAYVLTLSTTVELTAGLALKADLAGATFTGAIAVSGVQSAISATYSDDGAGGGPFLDLTRLSASPAGNDLTGVIRYFANDSDGNLDNYSQLMGDIVSPTSGAEGGRIRLRTVGAGSMNDRLWIAQGVYHPSATGGDKGAGTGNFSALYDDNVLLTCMAMAETFAEKGTFTDDDVAEWDARVPDQIEPARKEQKPVMEKAIVRQLVRDDDGSMKVAAVEVERQKVEPVPVYAEDGKTGLDMIEEPVFEEVEIPERVIPRVHHTARVFKAMVDDGFDPRNPAAYIAKMRADEALPGMPTKADWQHNTLSSGEMMSRLWLATEMLALAFATLTERVEALENA